MNRLTYKEDVMTNSGLNVQLFSGISLSDLVKLKCKEELTTELAKGYLQYISENDFSFTYSPENTIQSSRAILLFPNWKLVVIVTDIRKHAYIIGKDLENFSNSFPIPKDIEVKTLNLSGKLHISYYLLSIAREIVDKSPDADQIQDLVAYSAECIEETIADIEAYIYKCSMKSKAEIQNYLARYEEITEQDSLNYSISEDFNMISNLMSTQSKMSEWISEKMKNSNISDSSSIILFDVTRNGNNKANPFDLASSLEDKSSLQCPTVSVEEMIDSAFVNSLIEMGNKKRTIIIQVEDRRESCQCSVCPLM